MVGLLLIALGIGIVAYRSTTSRIVSDVPLEQEKPSNDFHVSFGPEVEERLVRVDLRIPAVLGLLGVGVIASAFIHRRS